MSVRQVESVAVATGVSASSQVRGPDDNDDGSSSVNSSDHEQATCYSDDGGVKDDVDDESGLVLAGYAARSWLRVKVLDKSHVCARASSRAPVHGRVDGLGERVRCCGDELRLATMKSNIH